MEKNLKLQESTHKCRCTLQSEKSDDALWNLTQHFILWSDIWLYKCWSMFLDSLEYSAASFTSSGKSDLEDELRMPYTWTHNGKHWGQHPAERHEEISETSEAQKPCYITSRCYSVPGFLLQGGAAWPKIHTQVKGLQTNPRETTQLIKFFCSMSTASFQWSSPQQHHISPGPSLPWSCRAPNVLASLPRLNFGVVA